MVNFIGKGLAFPLRLSDRDRLSMVDSETEIRQSIQIIIMTVPGERVMRPEFGCEIHNLIFHPANWQTAHEAERYVRDALLRWEPRIDVDSVIVTPGGDRAGELLIEIEYRLKGQPGERSLVYPFYLIPS